MAFSVNVGRSNEKALVHSTDCTHYRYRSDKSVEDGRWFCPVDTIGEALEQASESGCGIVRRAGCCKYLGKWRTVTGPAR